jgi:hypothetical protein
MSLTSTGFDSAAKQQAVEKILESPEFERREASKRILAYLLEQHINGTDPEIKEYVLATEVFGKPANFDPSTDASVRVAVGKLREQLEHYALTAGANNEVSVSIPRRHYRLHFESSKTIPSPPESIHTTPQGTSARRTVTFAVTGAALMVLGVVLGALWNAPPRRGAAQGNASGVEGPLFRAFWQPLAESRRQTLVSLGTPLFIRYDGHRLRASRVEDLEDAMSYAPMLKLKEILRSERFQESRNYTGVGEANSAFLVGNLLARRGLDAKLVRNNALTWEEIAASNVIFLGPPKFNPHLERIPAIYNFTVTGVGIRNIHPQDGEPEVYGRIQDEESEGQTIEDHVIVSRLPGLFGRGIIYTLASTATYGTWAGGLCVTQPPILEAALQRVAEPDGSLPEFFEMLIRVRFAENVPVSMDYVAHRRVHPRPNPSIDALNQSVARNAAQAEDAK